MVTKNKTPPSGAVDAREDAERDIAAYLVSIGQTPNDARNTACVLLSRYEIQSRCTEVMEVNKDKTDLLIRKFLISKTVAGCTDATIRNYGSGLKNILGKIGKDVSRITADDIRLYIALRVKKDGISDVTADNELRTLRTFYAWMQKEEIIEKNPMMKVDAIKVRKTQKKALSDDEIEMLRYAMKDDERMSAAMEVILSTGCRVAELVNIRVDEIEGDRILVHGKGNKDRYVYLNARARMSLDIYMGMRKDKNPYLFPAACTAEPGKSNVLPHISTDDWWKKKASLVSKTGHIGKGTIETQMRKYSKMAGVDSAHPHKLRRTCATMALRRGMPIEQVSKMLGHEQLDTTKIYLDLSEEDLRQAHKRYVT